jgi:short-subunit dehydrogenase
MPHAPLAQSFRTALVTGAAGGLGRAFAEMLLGEGVEVWGTSRNIDKLPAGPRFHALEFDLLDGDQTATGLMQRAERESGGIELLVHNAGFGVFGGFDAIPIERWSAQIAAMLGRALVLDHAALTAMRPRRRGAIVNVSSLAAEMPIPFLSGYNAAKAGLSALTESLMLEAAETGITFLDFRPGDYRTEFNRNMFEASTTSSPEAANRVWAALEVFMAEAPPPAKAAADLRRALRRGRSGVVRSGGVFQAVIAPRAVRLLPQSWRRAMIARYFHLR